MFRHKVTKQFETQQQIANITGNNTGILAPKIGNTLVKSDGY
jgi:hypothetical protein